MKCPICGIESITKDGICFMCKAVIPIHMQVLVLKAIKEAEHRGTERERVRAGTLLEKGFKLSTWAACCKLKSNTPGWLRDLQAKITEFQREYAEYEKEDE